MNLGELRQFEKFKTETYNHSESEPIKEGREEWIMPERVALKLLAPRYEKETSGTNLIFT